MKYKVMINGQAYKISMSDEADYVPKDDKDIIVYTVDMENQVIHARIENPSQHTLYLIQQGRCIMWLDAKRTHNWGKYRGNYSEGPDEGMRYSWKRGLQLTCHPKWTKRSSLFVKVTNTNNITLPFSTEEWINPDIYFLNYVADYRHNPDRTEYFITFKPILVSQKPDRWNNIRGNSPNSRAYQTHSKETTLIIQRE